MNIYLCILTLLCIQLFGPFLTLVVVAGPYACGGVRVCVFSNSGLIVLDILFYCEILIEHNNF